MKCKIDWKNPTAVTRSVTALSNRAMARFGPEYVADIERFLEASRGGDGPDDFVSDVDAEEFAQKTITQGNFGTSVTAAFAEIIGIHKRLHHAGFLPVDPNMQPAGVFFDVMKHLAFVVERKIRREGPTAPAGLLMETVLHDSRAAIEGLIKERHTAAEIEESNWDKGSIPFDWVTDKNRAGTYLLDNCNTIAALLFQHAMTITLGHFHDDPPGDAVDLPPTQVVLINRASPHGLDKAQLDYFTDVLAATSHLIRNLVELAVSDEGFRHPG